MQKITFLFLILFVFSLDTMAQIEEKRYKNEFSLNLTNALAKFSGNRLLLSSPDEPYVFGFKSALSKKENPKYMRFGINGDYVESNDFRNFATFNTTSFISASLGLEERIKIQKTLVFFYGIDLFYFNKQETTVSTVFTPKTFDIKLQNSREIFGISPLFGINWEVIKRVRIFTESYIRINTELISRTLEEDGFKQSLEKTQQYKLSVFMPSTIHVSIAF
jgi:hypothetical protein